MSQYIFFFIRNADTFLPIGCFCRSNEIYRQFQDCLNAPYEKIRALTAPDIKDIRTSVRNSILQTEASVKASENEKTLIASFNNTVEEKLNALDICNENISDYKDALENLKTADSYLSTLLEILNTVKYGYDEYDENSYLYYGIEISEPTVEDILD